MAVNYFWLADFKFMTDLKLKFGEKFVMKFLVVIYESSYIGQFFEASSTRLYKKSSLSYL
jgi:hypothetical protein